MDTFPHHQSSASLLTCGSMDDSSFSMPPLSTEEDSILDTGLWSGRAGEGASDFLGSLECGGALLNPGSWSISTSPGEGLRWNGVGKTDLFDEWAGQTLAPVNRQAATDVKCGKSTLAMQPKLEMSTTPMHLGVVKADPEEGRTSSVATPRVLDSGSPAAGNSISPSPAVSALNSPPITLRGLGYYGRERITQVLQSSTPGVTASTRKSTNSSSSRPSPRQPSSLRTAVAPVAAAPTITTKGAVKSENEHAEEDRDVEEEEEDAGKYDRDSEELEPGSELDDKRRRNREHAKRSRMRKRVRLGGLEKMLLELRRENVRLRQIVKQSIPERAHAIIGTCASGNTDADIVAKHDVVQGMRPCMTVGGASSGWVSGGGSRVGGGGSRTRPKPECGVANKDHRVPSALKLMSPSYQSVKALAESQANFILTNPNLPDCPIIFASQGFLELTGYEAGQVIGKNCRFLQGPGTDPLTVSIIRNNLAGGRDASVCIMNYKADGTPFWNQLSIGVLLDAHGQVANHVGVLCEVNQMPPAVFHRLLHRVPLPESLLNDELPDSGDDAVAARNTAAAAAACSAKQGGSGRSVSGSNSSAASHPRVVDRLCRTRASSASQKTYP